MKICFLLGSGVSIPAGLPSLAEITEQIMSGDRFMPTTDSDNPWIRLPEGQKTDLTELSLRQEKLSPILQFLLWLKTQAAVRYAGWPNRVVNYEDLAYLAEQIESDVLDNYENPALAPFIGRAIGQWRDFREQLADVKEIGRLARETNDYIHAVVPGLLDKPTQPLNYFELLRAAACDPNLPALDLFTLNHDLLLESFFEQQPPADGFCPADEFGIRRWNSETFDRATEATPKVRLFKLHGSVNWRRFRRSDSASPSHEEFVGIQSSVNTTPKRPFAPVGRTLFLTGTFNKLHDYNHHVFLELHHRFHRVLVGSDHVIVCGYGFGDKGVNERLIERMTTSLPCKSRLLVIDPASIDALTAKARVAIASKVDVWRREGRFIHWQLGLGTPDVTWPRIVEEFIRPG